MRSLFGWLQSAIVLFACILPATAQQDQVLLVEAVAPVYPMVAVYSSTTGEVTVKLTIDKTGAVISAKVIQGHRLLAASAEDAAKKWRFGAGSGDAEITVGFVFRILPKGTQEAELATRFRAPYQMEIRRVIPEASTNSDPAADPPRRKPK
jgi:TonB family protein